MIPSFTNMLSWWQWGVIAAVPPAVVLLYFLKLKRTPVEVPSTFLWHKSIEDLHVNSLFQWLKNSILLLLQLLVLLLAILALARPSWIGSELDGERFVLMIDNSASMAAVDVSPSRLEEAKRRAEEVIEGMPPGSAAMILSFSDSARVEQSLTDNKRELLRKLQGIRQTQKPTNLLEALQVASGLANPGVGVASPTLIQKDGRDDVQVVEGKEATVYIFSDGKAPPTKNFVVGNLKPFYVPIGDLGDTGTEPKGNTAIVAFSTKRNEEKRTQLQAFAQLENYGAVSVTTDLGLYANGLSQPVDVKQVSIDGRNAETGEPGALRVAFDLAEFESGVLELKIEKEDALDVDNRAWSPVNPPTPINMLLVSPGSDPHPLKLVLSTERAKKLAEVHLADPAFMETEEYKQESAGGTYHLIIYEGCVPAKMPQANTLFVGELPNAQWSSTGKGSGPIVTDIDRAHPMMSLVDLGDVVIGPTLTGLKSPPGGTVLIDSDLGPLCMIAPRDGYQDAVLTFKLVDGDKFGTTWWVKPSFPVFVLNLLSYVSGVGSALDAGSVQPGKTISLRGQAAGNSIRIKNPAGQLESVTRSNRNTFDYASTDRLGLYEVQWSDTATQHFAVNLFDRGESDIRPKDKLELGEGEPVQGSSQASVARKEAWKLLLLLGLGMLILEWWIYNRRVAL